MTTPSTRRFGRTFFAGSIVGAAALAALIAGSPSEPSAVSTNLLTPAPALAGHPARTAVGTQFSDVAEAVLPAVVWIETTTIQQVPDGMFGGDQLFERFFGGRPQQDVPREYRQNGLGSGVVIDADGTIVTNHHVAGMADELEVTLSDGRKFEAKLLGTDPGTDLAVIRLEGDVSGLTSLSLGDSDALRLGEVVMAIGNPFGLRGSVSLGIVSAKDRTGMGINRYENYIQTDAAINKGNSGGALVNMRGELVGINDAIYSPSMGFGGGGNVGIGFAIPTNQARPIIDQLVANGRVERGYLGVNIQDLDPAMTAGFSLEPDTRGVILARVADGSPAEKAGVRAGDVVVSVDGEAVENSRELQNVIAAAGPGHKAKLRVYRGGKQRNITVELGTMPDRDGELARRSEDVPKNEDPVAVEMDGLKLGELSSHRRYFGIDRSIGDGVIVLGVEAGSNAAEAGLRTGDVIVEVNRAPVKSVAEMQTAVKGTNGPPLFLVRRGDATLYAVLE